MDELSKKLFEAGVRSWIFTWLLSYCNNQKGALSYEAFNEQMTADLLKDIQPIVALAVGDIVSAFEKKHGKIPEQK